MELDKKETFESEFKLLKDRGRHPYLHMLLGHLKPGDVVLDMGCGLLVNLHYLKNNGFKVVGVDLSFRMLQQNNNHDIAAICADGTKLPFKNHSFNCLLLVDIIEHLPAGEMDAFMKELGRVLGNDGIIFLHVPLEKSLCYRMLDRARMIWPKNPNHLQDYDLKEISSFIEKEGFKVLWEHKENGIVYSLRHHLRKAKLSEQVKKHAYLLPQNAFTVSYTACLKKVLHQREE